MTAWKSVEVRLSQQKKNIPYAADAANDVHQVIWLSKEPQRIDEIPELNRDPELKSVVKEINSPGCRFETFRCGSLTEEDEGKFYSNFNIGLIYRDRRAFADYGAQLMVAGEILGFSTDSDIFPASSRTFLIEIQQVNLTTEGIQGWTVDLWYRCAGETAQEATNQATRALSFLKNVLSAKYP
ncbi:hypothetical protein ACKWMZ_26945 [Pseudomonas protegens]|uniref:hypothetical protein n=1 Tax=Pseudomonas protegens TaxID=380021 RepID=UPI00396712B9